MLRRTPRKYRSRILPLIDGDFFKAAVQDPQPAPEARRVRDDQRGVAVWSGEGELVEVDAGVGAVALHGAHGLVGFVEDDAVAGAVGAALGALPEAEVGSVVVGAGMEVVDVCGGGGAEGGEAGPD